MTCPWEAFNLLALELQGFSDLLSKVWGKDAVNN